MLGMVMNAPGQPLLAAELQVPSLGPHDLLVRVRACGVCRTDLHVVDGELPNPKPLVVPGHEVVGKVAAVGPAVSRFAVGDRVGIPWLGETCGNCQYCTAGRENLCDFPQFTGYTRDGGYAEYTTVHENFALAIPAAYSDVEAAPLLCAGLIGYRSLRMAGDARRLGIYGFGAAAHIVAQFARYESREVFAFTRPNDQAAQQFAMKLGATWAGSATDRPTELDAAVIFAPAGDLVPLALAAVKKGGVVVCGGIHMSDIPAFPYRLLWGERVVRSVANLTRRDGEEFLDLAPKIPIRPHPVCYPLAQANAALDDLRCGRLVAAAVLIS
jgi:alcohol dehydrogenase, propanol-preferring